MALDKSLIYTVLINLLPQNLDIQRHINFKSNPLYYTSLDMRYIGSRSYALKKLCNIKTSTNPLKSKCNCRG